MLYILSPPWFANRPFIVSIMGSSYAMNVSKNIDRIEGGSPIFKNCPMAVKDQHGKAWCMAKNGSIGECSPLYCPRLEI